MAILKNTIINDTGYLQLPAGSTVQRPTGSTGMIRVNTNTTPYTIEIYQASTWRTLKVLY
jgi:hypothetical protein